VDQATIGRAEEVVWYDSSTAIDGWQFLEDLQVDPGIKPLKVYSLGYKIFENEHLLVLAADDGGTQCGRRITIPKICILHRSYINIPDRED
jgi:hypothetical protein